MQKSAILVLDMQNDLVHPDGKIGATGFAAVAAKRELVPNITRLLSRARKGRFPVVFARVGYRSDYLDALSRSSRLERLKSLQALTVGSWGSEIILELNPLPEEMVFTKQAVNPFFNTGLLTWLLNTRIESLVLCGVFTHMVVDSTARFADDAGFQVTVLEDCCASPDPELHRMEMEKILPMFGKVMSSKDFLSTQLGHVPG